MRMILDKSSRAEIAGRLKEKAKGLPKRIVFGAWRGLRNGFGGRRLPRYTGVGAAGVMVIWILATAYLSFTPRTYVGEFVLFLPGAGSGASINLNAIGQASSMSESAFSNTRVSPTESYKRLLLSDRVVKAAAIFAGVENFPQPRVKLLDQTQFMEVAITANSPIVAQAYARALEQAFLSEVDHLRREDRTQREAGYGSSLQDFEATVSAARAALLKHQSTSGLATIQQYNDRIRAVDNLQSELNRSRIDEAESRERLDALLEILNIAETEASAALTFAADPVFVQLAQGFAEVETELASVAYKFGENHPQRAVLNREHSGLGQEIIARGALIAKASPDQSLSTARKLIGAEYTALLKEIVEADARYRTAMQRTRSLSEALINERESLAALSEDAAELEDLNRALQVAEAVFRSAIARIDTTKSDLYASYPLIQTVEAPEASSTPSSPIPALAIIGAGGATVMYILGLILLCLRLPLLNLLLKRK